ncbi:MAG: NifU family protein [Candidatus Poseidoniaceae archaeon]|mgnify:FL=1|nr:NifU family protein [Candidatus Poseidoniaceae archaeon]
MADDDLIAKYAAQASKSIAQEAEKRIAESTNPKEEARLKGESLLKVVGSDDFVPALLARLGPVRAALDGHGGGIAVQSYHEQSTNGVTQLDLILDLTGACLSCGAAPGTLDGIKADLEGDNEVLRIRYSKNLLDTFDELGREFILAHGNVEFV